MAESGRSASKCTHLIVVCGHAIWLGGPTSGKDESEWALEGFQRGETPTFISHILAGIEEHARDERSILVFSGGSTKPKVTALSEAKGYYSLAKALQPNTIDDGTVLEEELATDSFQNLLFSLLLFCRRAGHPPSHLTVVSHAFKRERVLRHHLPALCWPSDRISYIGIDPTQSTEGWERIRSGEAVALAQWTRDPWGWGPELQPKRIARGWQHTQDLDVETNALVHWDGGPTRTERYPGVLPWSHT